MGGQLEACSAGCVRACSLPDAGPGDAGPIDAGPFDGGAASCTCTGVSCTAGSLRCGGCFGFDDFCDDAAACASACGGQATCDDNGIMLNGQAGATCDFCPGDCGYPEACAAVCPASAL